MNISGKWKHIGLGGSGIYDIWPVCGRIKRIARMFLISAIGTENSYIEENGRLQAISDTKIK